MGFLEDLANQISDQFSLGENTQRTLDLGDFKFDQSAERKYVEEGYLRQDPYNIVPKQFEILTQEPNATVLVKKRMFSSVAENFRPDFMDADEKLYYRAIRILFQNKCNQIAALEKLSKIQRVTSIIGQIDNYMIPVILSITDTLNDSFDKGSLTTGGETDSLIKIADRLKRIYGYNVTSPYTNWVVDSTNLLKSQYATGTGVLELTNFSSINTSVSIDMASPGSCSFTLYDPYGAMFITEYDIERAIADATNMYYNRKTFQLGKESADTLINELQTRLNQYRSVRGASLITFKINPDTLLGKRVTAIIDRQALEIPFTYYALSSLATLGFKGGETLGVKVPDEYLIDGAIAGSDGLDNKKHTYGGPSAISDSFNLSGNRHYGSDSELTLFCRLIKTIFDKLTLMANSHNAFQTANQNTTYARRKLRFNFLGKLIIQPMDVVHVYMTSRSRFDNQLLGGLQNMFNGGGFLQKATQQLSDLKNAFQNFDAMFSDQGGSIDLQIEKSAFVGREFPTWLWQMVRSQFVNENEGVHVFAGLIDSSQDNWRDGQYIIDVRCTDNTKYFEMGKVNFNPGVDVFNGAVFDPLTPFKTNFDTINSNAKSENPELLEENKWLLLEAANGGKGEQPIVKHKNGPSVGLPVTEKSVIQDKSTDPLSGLLTRTFYAPDGLVYKWKEGIGVQVQYGSSSDLNGPNKVGFPNIYKDPFAGQDVMNVISLLITGLPYNFATYWKAISSPNYNNDPNANRSAASTFYESLRTTLSRNNLLWGNFIPFKSLSVNEEEYAKRLKGQFDIVNQNDKINDKLNKLKDIYDKLKIFGVAEILNDSKDSIFADVDSGMYNLLKTQAKELEKEINTLVNEQVVQNEDIYNIAGNDVEFDIMDDPDFATDETGVAQRNTLRKKLRRQLNYLTRRMSYNVRANDDKNLFIVDDQYDKDYDIIAYNKELSNIKLYNNSYVNVKENIKTVASLLNLEVFCDTQGHIRVRPPQYNRVPSSVFYRMMYMKDKMGIQVFPEFLSDLFKNQLEEIKLQIELIEDYIRLYCAILGYDTDMGCYIFISSYSTDSKTGNTGFFEFISNDNGAIAAIDKIIKEANPDSKDISQGLELYETIHSQAILRRNILNTAGRTQALIEVLSGKKLSLAGYSINETDKVIQNTVVQNIAQRISDKSGIKVKVTDYISTKPVVISGEVQAANYTVDVFKIFNDISEKIAERQKAVKLFYSLLKNYKESTSLNSDQSITNKLLTDGNFNNSNIPEIFEHMIEDESYDDLGPGSGKRYVIKRAQILSMTFFEQPPPMTFVEVQGTLNPYAPSGLPQGLASFPSGGNAMTTAQAVDYDMWRNYGFRSQAPINVPFLQDPNRQCAPFASMILSRARKEVLRGSVTISGNEFMQPGEVVFIEDRGLLFYVQSVRHNFNYGGGFTTTLELTYGHAPGEYIPTTLDIMGKMLYNNRDLANIIINRQESSLNERSLGVILFDPTTKLVINGKGTDSSSKTIYSDQNMRTINNILYLAQQFVNKNKDDSGAITKITRVQLRTYYDNNNEPNQDLQDFKHEIMKILRGYNDAGPKSSYNTNVKAVTPWIQNPYALQSEDINMSDEEDPRSPSQQALNFARDMVSHQASSDYQEYLAHLPPSATKNGNSNKKKIDALRNVLFTSIVDCWLVYEDVPQTGT